MSDSYQRGFCSPAVRIIHETAPAKYFAALYRLHDERRIRITGAHRYSIAKETLRSLLKEKRTLRQHLSNLKTDIRLRVALPGLRDETIVLAIAPWDWRLLLYRHLARRNRILYHTSWPDWRYNAVPRRYPPVDRLYRRLWHEFLRHDNVWPIVVQPQIAQELEARLGVQSTVIPHVVSDEFFDAAQSAPARRADGLRLIYVGELSEKKGVRELIGIARATATIGVILTVVGDGPLRTEVAEAARRHPNVNFTGPESDRKRLAELMSGHDLLLLLSRRTRTWQELFGIVIIEALAAGLGVIATDHVGPRSIFGDSDRGNLFAEDDITGVERLIRRLSASRIDLETFIARQSGLADAYRLGAVAERWAAVIDEQPFRMVVNASSHRLYS